MSFRVNIRFRLAYTVLFFALTLKAWNLHVSLLVSFSGLLWYSGCQNIWSFGLVRLFCLARYFGLFRYFDTSRKFVQLDINVTLKRCCRLYQLYPFSNRMKISKYPNIIPHTRPARLTNISVLNTFAPYSHCG